MLNGWFFVQGDVGGWLREMLKGKHQGVLRGIDIDAKATGFAVAWCSPPEVDGVTSYLPPIGQAVHVPYDNRKPCKGLHISSTVSFLSQRIVDQRTVDVDEDEAVDGEKQLAVDKPMTVYGAAGNTEADEADEGEPTEPARKKAKARGWDWDQQELRYQQPELNDSLFPDNKYRGKYADQGEGAGVRNQLKHVLRAYCASDWSECDQLVRKYSERHQELVFRSGSLKVRTMREI